MRSRLLSAGLVAASVVAAALLAAAGGRSWLDAVFLGVVLAAFCLILQVTVGTWLDLVLARRRERQVASVRPEEVARRAVEAERARLSAEIDGSVRRSLHRVEALAQGATHDADPRPALLQIQAESRTAIQELRRQLGLITPTAGPVAEAVPASAPASSTARPTGRDAVLVGAVTGLITLEELMFDDVVHASWPMAFLLALTLLWRRAAPVPAALAAALVITAGAVLGPPVPDGFSYPLMCGLLLWAVLVRPPGSVTLLTGAVLLAAATGSRWANDPANGPFNVVVLSLVAACALVAGAQRRASSSASSRAAALQLEVDRARRQAVDDERRALARELHDVASHAVSLVAVQAGAAELAWDQEPATARKGLQTIQTTVAAALHQLSQRQWGVPTPATWDDVLQVVRRMREAGLEVSLETDGRPPPTHLSTVHRLVQEALTNVLRHAPGAPTTVRIVCRPAGTEVEITDEGAATVATGKGYGLVGLEDRVRAAGGTFTAGPTGTGGFRVHAVLPHPSRAPHTRSSLQASS